MNLCQYIKLQRSKSQCLCPGRERITKLQDSYIWLSQGYTKVGFGSGDRSFAEETHAGLKEAVEFLSGYFHVESGSLSVRAVLAGSRNEYDRLVGELLGVHMKNPSGPRRIAQTQGTDLVFLSPRVYPTDSAYEYSTGSYRRLVLHETTHVFEEYLSPNVEAIPRWWTEGLAVYLSEQWEQEEEFRGTVLGGIKRREIPSVRELAENVSLSYLWGWTIVRYVEYMYGAEMIRNIIEQCADGDVVKIIGEKARKFQTGWAEYLKIEKNNLWPD